jgi:hypothetical protein
MPTTDGKPQTSPVARWQIGGAVSARKLNEMVDAINARNPAFSGIPPPWQLRRTRGGGSSSFVRAVLREVNVDEKVIKVQRIRYTGDDPDSNEPTDRNSGCYKKIAAYGPLVEAHPPEGSTYAMFESADNIRPVEDIPSEGEDLGWTCNFVKLYRDGMIEWAFDVNAGVERIDPNDPVISA